MDKDNQIIQQIQTQITQLRDELAVERSRINSLWWKIALLAGLVSAVIGKVFGSTVGAAIDILTGWW